MTSPQRGPAPHPQGRGAEVVPGDGLHRSGRRQPAGRAKAGPAESPLPAPAEAPRRRPPLARSQGEEALRAALAAAGVSRTAVRYRGFVLLPQPDLGWLVRPERSPMTVLPFRTPPISLSDVKALVDWRLDGAPLTRQPQDRARR